MVLTQLIIVSLSVRCNFAMFFANRSSLELIMLGVPSPVLNQCSLILNSWHISLTVLSAGLFFPDSSKLTDHFVIPILFPNSS